MRKYITVLLLLVMVNNGYTQGKNDKDQILKCDPISILIEPVSQTVCIGSTAKFYSEGSYVDKGSWEVSTDNGATWSFLYLSENPFDTLVIQNVTPLMNNYKYRRLFSNSCYMQPSNGASLIISNLPTIITKQPAEAKLCVGNNVTFSIAATGSTLNYQWQSNSDIGNNFINIDSAHNPDLFISNIQTTLNNTRYRCLITSECNSQVISDIVSLIINPITTQITKQPVDQAICAGGTAKFVINAAGENIAYQWQVYSESNASFEDVTNATSATLNLPYSINNIKKRYACKVSSNCPTIYSQSRILDYIQHAPQILEQPVVAQYGSITGDSFLIKLKAIGTYLSASEGSYPEPITYQWQSGDINGNNFVDIPSAINSELSIAYDSTIINTNSYRCKVSGKCLSNYSNIIKLKITNVTWTGNQDNQYYNGANWSNNQIPQSTSDIYIPAGRPHYPEINGTFYCHGLYVSPNASIKINTGGNLIITGN